MNYRLSTLVGLMFTTALLSGCTQFKDIKKNFLKFSSQSQIESPVKHFSPSKVVNKKPLVKKRVSNNNCSYIVRDLSKPKATDVWCRPKHVK